MNKKVLILTLVLTAFTLPFVFVVAVRAQSSSSVKTRIGNPPTQASSCPIPNGTPSCGSENVPMGGCGHCTSDYIGGDPNLLRMCSDPNYPGIHYAMDVPAKPNDPVYLPSINGEKIKWVWSHYAVDSDGITGIQYYMGTNENTGEQYWIQFHHVKPGGSQITLYSGDEGAQLCIPGCKTGSGPHVHIEFAKVTADGVRVWQDAPNYFCGGN